MAPLFPPNCREKFNKFLVPTFHVGMQTRPLRGQLATIRYNAQHFLFAVIIDTKALQAIIISGIPNSDSKKERHSGRRTGIHVDRMSGRITNPQHYKAASSRRSPKRFARKGEKQ